MLVDMAPEGETFDVYKTSGSYVPKNTLAEGGYWQGGNIKKFDLKEMVTTEVSYMPIAYGWMDLCNPEAGYDSATADKQISLVEGEYNDYTIYLQPNLYEVQEGHTLALIIYTYHPGKGSYSENYNITLDNRSVAAEIPVHVNYGNVGELDKPEVEPEAPEAAFVDVASSHWFYNDVMYVVENGLMNGTSDNTFSPNSTTTRAMLMTILARLDGVNTDGGATWYEKGMEWAMENGISDGSNPTGNITREQLATMLWRYAGSPEVEGDLSAFSDADQVSDYAVQAMIWAVENGIVTGNGDGTLNPQGNATRAQMAAMLHRFCENVL